MRARHTVESLVFVVAIVAAGAWAVHAIRARRPDPGLAPVRDTGALTVVARELAREPARVEVEAYGTLLPARRATLAPEVGGPLARVHPGWREGLDVARGEELFAVDPRLHEIDVEVAEAGLAEAEAARRGAELQAREAAEQLVLARRGHELARRELERLTGLERGGVTSASALDAARRVDSVAELEVERAEERQGVAAVESEIAAARLAGARAALALARERLERTAVAAPFDGRLVGRPPAPGTWLVPGAPVAELVDLGELQLSLQVPEAELPGLRPGLRARVTLPARPGLELVGSVGAVGAVADPATRSAPVEVDVPNAPGVEGTAGGEGTDGAPASAEALAAGQFARAVVEVARLDDVLVLARDEVDWEAGRPSAWVLVGADGDGVGRAERRGLELGRRVVRGDGVVGRVVTSGLAPGETLVTWPLERLREGLACRPRDLLPDAAESAR